MHLTRFVFWRFPVRLWGLTYTLHTYRHARSPNTNTHARQIQPAATANDIVVAVVVVVSRRYGNRCAATELSSHRERLASTRIRASSVRHAHETIRIHLYTLANRRRGNFLGPAARNPTQSLREYDTVVGFSFDESSAPVIQYHPIVFNSIIYTLRANVECHRSGAINTNTITCDSREFRHWLSRESLTNIFTYVHVFEYRNWSSIADINCRDLYVAYDRSIRGIRFEPQWVWLSLFIAFHEECASDCHTRKQTCTFTQTYTLINSDCRSAWSHIVADIPYLHNFGEINRLTRT